MSETYVAPEHGLDAFHCPSCGVYAHQHFAGAMRTVGGTGPLSQALTEVDGYSVSACSRCSQPLIWYGRAVVHPRYGSTPTPHSDMPEGVKSDYEEARQVSDLSPRSASALLRLALQKLCVELGQPGRSWTMILVALSRKGWTQESKSPSMSSG